MPDIKAHDDCLIHVESALGSVRDDGVYHLGSVAEMSGNDPARAGGPTGLLAPEDKERGRQRTVPLITSA